MELNLLLAGCRIEFLSLIYYWQVAVLAMDGSTFTANSFLCFNTELATGTQDNLNNLLSFVQGLSPTNSNATLHAPF